MRTNRRVMLATGAMTAVAAWNGLRSAAEDAPAAEATGLGPLCLFAKHLQWLSHDALAQLLVDLDVAGIEATIRRGGQVEPADVGQGLPRLAEALGRRDRRVVIMTTDIHAVESPHAETTLRTAADLGIRHYRMAYYRYDLDRPILPQLDRFTKVAEDLAELNRSLGLIGLYQNHAGERYVGAPLWDLRQMLDAIDSQALAAAYDLRHATVEAGMSWALDWAMIRPRVGAIYLKDFHWRDGKVENVPLGTGQVSPRLFAAARDLGRPVPVSIHMEYIDHRDPDLIDACVAAYRADREAARRLIGV